MTERHDAVVVGAGISGLAAAWRLSRAGVETIVLEAADRPGGVIASRRVDGFLVEAGPNTVATSPETEALVAELDLAPELVRAPPGLPRFVYRSGALRRVPTGPIDLITSRILSPAAKLRVLGEPLIARPRTSCEESVAEFFRRRFGAEVYAKVVAPFLSGTFAGDGEKLSMRAVFPTVAELEARHRSVLLGFLGHAVRGGLPAAPRGLFSFRDGFETLPRRLAARLGDAVRTANEAVAIAAEAGGAWRVRLAGGRDVLGRAVVVAVPPVAAARLLDRVTPDAAAALREFQMPPLACVSLAWPRTALSRSADGFGFLVPRGEGPRILGCLWTSSMFPGRAPADQTLFTSFIGGALDPNAPSLPDEELFRVVERDVAAVAGASGRARALGIDRYAHAIPQYEVGHAARVARIRSGVAGARGVFLAGNYVAGIAIADCLREGERAARDVVQHLTEPARKD